ncbi:hypothetical protein [Streptomyces sp. NPDC048436]|uniref:hypothetical protein n=1 Tax=Streptomyces sp. NPDC048436 TaxID=3365550 RepID=UPI003719220D
MTAIQMKRSGNWSVPKQTNPRGYGNRVFYSAHDAIMVFSSLASRAGGDYIPMIHRFLPDLLLSDEAVVPHFNSPPSQWVPLRGVAEQASAIGLGVTAGGDGLPVLVGAYLGGLFLVKFIGPIVTEAGNATAAGVGAKIRTAFGVSPGIPLGENAEQQPSQSVEPSSGDVEGSAS